MIARIIGITILAFMINYAASAQENPERASLSISRLFAKYEDYLGLADKERNAFNLVYKIASKKVSPENVIFYFTHNGEDIEISPSADGILYFRPTQEMLEANPIAVTNQPKGSLTITLVPEVNLPKDTRQAIKAVHDQTHIVWNQVRKFVGFEAVFMPKHASLSARFDETCVIEDWGVKVDGKAMPLGKDTTLATIDFSKKKIRNAETITFACQPIQFLLGVE